MMKKLIVGILCVLHVSLLYAGDRSLADTKANREREANRYLEIVPPIEMFDDMTERMALQLPEAERKKFVESMRKHMDLEKFDRTIRDSIVKHFTAHELKALANFYGSRIGKSAMQKFGAYMADVMPQILIMMIEAQTKVMLEKQQ
jgi:hypothetical protein